MDRAKTVTDAKVAFLRTQVRLLSAILQPSRQWRDFTDNAEEDDLSDKVINDVMSKGKHSLAIPQPRRLLLMASPSEHEVERAQSLCLFLSIPAPCRRAN
jgi:hypothetical protein